MHWHSHRHISGIKMSDSTRKFGYNFKSIYGNTIPVKDSFVVEKRFLPFGQSERSDFQRRSIMHTILKTPMKHYISQFLYYFMNDECSLKQYLRHTSLKPTDDSALLKLSSLEPSQTLNAGSLLDDENDSISNSEVAENSGAKYRNNSTYDRSSVRSESSSCYELYESIIGVSKIDEINKMIDDELTDHYFKVSNYQSFFIDVTKLLITAPKIGLDLLDAPNIMLRVLDHKIIPLFYSTLENMTDGDKSMDIPTLMKMCESTKFDFPSDVDSMSVSNFLEYVLGDLNLNNTKELEYRSKNNQFKFNLTARLKNIPPTADIWKRTVNDIHDDDVGKMITLTATVVLAGVMSILEEEREYKCRKCNKSFICKSVPESEFLINVPSRCPNLNISETQKCDGTTFTKGQYNKRSDYQEIRCQSVSNISCGMNLNTIVPVVLRREIAGKCSPGDTVNIVAFVSRRWKKLRRGERCDSEIFLDAVNVETVNWHISKGTNLCDSIKENRYELFWVMNRDNEIAARNMIIDGVNPSLVNLDNSKLALILTLIGGFSIETTGGNEAIGANRWAKYSTNNRKGNFNASKNDLRSYLCSGASNNAKCRYTTKKGGSRTQCHALLVGDPGTGKSQLLKCAGDLSFRHISVSGTNCTSVGLTCTLVRDGPEVMLAAGALVLAAGGVCCIDEFASIRAADKSCLHEAMEQQKISVAKAGIKCTLNCQCSIVAASNFKPSKNGYSAINDASRYGPNNIKVLNIDIPLPLLSRFDLILVFFDNSTCDEDLSEFLLNENMKHKIQRPDDQMLIDWSVGTTIKEYIGFVKDSFFPVLSDASKTLINAYYTALRKQSVESTYGGGPTVRSLESLIRLSQAHARLMYRNAVTLFDTVSIIWVNEFSLQGYGIGCINGGEQVLDRQGLFPDVTEIVDKFSRNFSKDTNRQVYKLSNGIKTKQMYDFFENLLLSRLRLKKTEFEGKIILINS